jgi:hypothetical protein
MNKDDVKMEGEEKTTIQFRWDMASKNACKIMAKSYGISMSDYLRNLVLRDYQKYRDVKLAPALTARATKTSGSIAE